VEGVHRPHRGAAQVSGRQVIHRYGRAGGSAAGHSIVNMADFAATDRPPAQVCIERVQQCNVYVGVLGTRYGSPLRDRPERSYTELEYDTAGEAGIP
jgi:hypothetical protein